MPEEHRQTLRYQILRYTPNLVRDEWVNIGVLLEEVASPSRPPGPPGSSGPRRAIRLIEEDTDIARIRRLHASADENLIRALADEFDMQLRAPEAEVATYFERLDHTLSNALQFSPERAVLAEDFDAELERLFRSHVARPPSGRGRVVENTRKWIRDRFETVFRRHHILGKLERSVRVEEFTQPGDPLRLDYAYRYNGTRGYVQMVSLSRHPSQAKVLAYTVERIRTHQRNSEFAAITDADPARENRRHQFMARLFEEQHITIVPPNQIEKFAETLRVRLQ
jgi:hypothetical protein